MNKTKQTYLEKLDAMEEHIGKKINGIITEINEITNTKYFGVQSNYGERNGIAVTVKIIEENDEFTNWFSMPNKNRGLEQSNIWAFKKKYNSYPKIDLQVECKIDENGFYRIDY